MVLLVEQVKTANMPHWIISIHLSPYTYRLGECGARPDLWIGHSHTYNRLTQLQFGMALPEKYCGTSTAASEGKNTDSIQPWLINCEKPG